MLYIRLRTEEERDRRAVEVRLAEVGTAVRRVGADALVAKVVNGNRQRLLRDLKADPRVALATTVDTPYVLSSRQVAEGRTRVPIHGGTVVGSEAFVVMAGPCTVESREQTLGVAGVVRDAGALVLRGGAFKPRTSPYSFQGLGKEGLEILAQAREETGLAVISEVMDQRELELVDGHVDILQVGMRNALNYALLRDIGQLPSRRPVLIKCGIGTTLGEFLSAADYVLAGGNPNVILCLRGTIGMTEARASMNITDLPLLRKRTHLPIIMDPSHVAGRWDLVPAIAAAALVAGADGLLVEVHEAPENALADGDQSLMPGTFHRLMHRLRLLAATLGRTMATAPRPRVKDTGHPLHDLCIEGPSGPALCTARRTETAVHATNMERMPS